RRIRNYFFGLVGPSKRFLAYSIINFRRKVLYAERARPWSVRARRRPVPGVLRGVSSHRWWRVSGGRRQSLRDRARSRQRKTAGAWSSGFDFANRFRNFRGPSCCDASYRTRDEGTEGAVVSKVDGASAIETGGIRRTS